MLIQFRRERALRRALGNYADSLLANLPSEAELARQYTFSPEFEARMALLLQQARREAVRNAVPERQADRRIRPASRHSKRLVLIAVILSILMSMFGIVAAREPIARFLVQVYEKFSAIVFNTPDTAGGPQTPNAPAVSPGAHADRTPAWLPDGYAQDYSFSNADTLQIVFTNAEDEELVFERRTATGSGIIVDTEGQQAERIMVGEHQGYYYVNKNIHNLIWQIGDKVYIISGNITKETAIKIANSTK